MSQLPPDDEEWEAPRGGESQESYMYSTQPPSQQLPFSPRYGAPQYILEEPDQPESDNNSIDMDSLVERQLEEPAITTKNTNTGASNAELGNLISRPHIVDPQQEVNDTFSFATHNICKSSQQPQSAQEKGSTAAIVGGGDRSNVLMSSRRVSIPHSKASPLRNREPPISIPHSKASPPRNRQPLTRKAFPEQARETEQHIPVFSGIPIQRNENIEVTAQQHQQCDFQEHHDVFHHQDSNIISSPGTLKSDGIEGRGEVMQSTHEEEQEHLSRGVHPSADPQLAATKQHKRTSESASTSSSYAFEKPSQSAERHGCVPPVVPVSFPAPEDLGTQHSTESGEDSIKNPSVTQTKEKSRQSVGGGKRNIVLQAQAERTPQASDRQSLEPNRRAQDAANPNAGRRYSEVTKNEGPGDLTFSVAKPDTSKLQHKPGDQAFRQASRVRPSRRNPETPVMTRPMRDAPPQKPPCRPTSCSSNVSKPRAPVRKSHPAERAMVGDKLNNDFRGLTSQWNSYFNRLEEYRDNVETELKDLREYVGVQKEDIAEYIDQIQAQSRVIDHTAAERDEWSEQAKKEKDRADSYLSKVGSLHGKCKEFRNQLNAATEEQQSLYRRNRELIVAAQKEQTKRSEEIQEQNEKIRDGIRKSVIEVSKEAQGQIAKLNEETSTLRVQLDERQKELSNEKDVAEYLRKELDQARLQLSHNVQTLTSQNEKILENLEECRKNEVNANLMNEQTQRLDTVLKCIEDVRVSNHGTVADLVQSLKNDCVKEVVGAIREEMTSKQPITTAEKEALTAGIGSIQGLCDHIYNQVRDDQHSQKVQYMYQESQHQLQILEERLQETLEQWEQAESWNFEFGQANEELQAELRALEEENKELQIHSDATQALNDENCSLLEQIEQQQEQINANSSLEEQVVSLNATITSLQTEVEAHQDLEEQVACLEERITEKDRMVKKSEKVSKYLERCLEKADRRSKGIEKRFQDDRLQLQERLQSTEEERSRLEQDLTAAEERIHELSSARSSEDTEMRKLREKTEEQTATIEEFTKQVQILQQTQKERCLNKLIGQIDWTRTDNPALPADLTEERIRRVVVQSPMPMEEMMVESPPSVQQEREARRQAAPPKSIMRVTSEGPVVSEVAENSVPEAEDDPNGPQPVPEKPIISNHSIYNRPVKGASNDQSAHGSWPGNQKRARSSSISNDARGRNDAKHVNKRARSVDVTESRIGPSSSTRSRLSQSTTYGPPDSEDEITEKDMSTPTFGGNLRSLSQSQRGGPLSRQTSNLVTYSQRGPESSSSYATRYSASQASIASSQTISQGSLGSQPSSAPSRLEGTSQGQLQGQGQGQQRKLPFKRRHGKS